MLGGVAQDQFGAEHDVERMPFRAGDLGEQFAHHAGAHRVDRLTDRGQPGDGLLRVRRVVESDDGHVVGNAAAKPVQGVQRPGVPCLRKADCGQENYIFSAPASREP